MQILPAIDILGGRVVRLKQGRLDAVTVYNADPVDQALAWAAAGAEWIHVVDLDGAVTGRPVNIEVGRGDRSRRRRARTGRRRDPEHHHAPPPLRCRSEPHGTRHDARDAARPRRRGVRRVPGQSWPASTRATAWWPSRAGARAPTARSSNSYSSCRRLGVSRVVYTDIALDGMQTGVNAEAYRALAAQT